MTIILLWKLITTQTEPYGGVGYYMPRRKQNKYVVVFKNIPVLNVNVELCLIKNLSQKNLQRLLNC